MDRLNYSVVWTEYSARHYVKNFQKKYKSNWERTVPLISQERMLIEKTLELNVADLIQETSDHNYKIVKLDFNIYGMRTSPKASGNRCILFVDTRKQEVQILLVYHKGDVRGGNETIWWKNEITEAYPEVVRLFR